MTPATPMTQTRTTRINIQLWSDYVCPFCYLELPVLQQLKREFGPRINVIWHAFELRPDPVPTLDPQGEYLHTVWNRSVYPMAAERGMQLRLPPVQPHSRKAFEAAAFARDSGRFDEIHEALFKAFFEQGRDISDMDVLTAIADAAQCDGQALRQALEVGRYTQSVRDDQRRAHELGVTGVPFCLVHLADQPLDAAIVLQGAVPYMHLAAAVRQISGVA